MVTKKKKLSPKNEKYKSEANKFESDDEESCLVQNHGNFCGTFRGYMRLIFSCSGERINSIDLGWKGLLIWDLLVLFVLTLSTVLVNSLAGSYKVYSDLRIALSVIIGFPIVLLLIFVIFYIFMNSLSGELKKFWQTFLLFLMIILPFILLFNLIGLISELIQNFFFIESNLVVGFFSLIYFIVSVWFLKLFINSFKKYYKTSYSVVFSSVIINIIFYILTLVIFYLDYLIKIIKR